MRVILLTSAVGVGTLIVRSFSRAVSQRAVLD
jgi:hypothetical protein